MIGVVGPDDVAARLASSLEVADVRTGDADVVVEASPDVAVGIGEAAVSALVRAGVEVPVLPVAAGAALDSVAEDRVPAVIASGLDAGFTTRERPVLGVSIGGGPPELALFDAMLVTSDPARITEFAVGTSGGTDRYRADGVVVATPAGSGEYARAVGGPVLDADASSLVVVPVAAFTTRSTVRVTDGGATIDIRVERDEGDVSLLVDGEVVGDVPSRRPVTVGTVGIVETATDPRE